MPINMVWRWEVRGPGGLEELEVELLLEVRMLLDTWSSTLHCCMTGLLIMVCRGAAWAAYNRSCRSPSVCHH